MEEAGWRRAGDESTPSISRDDAKAGHAPRCGAKYGESSGFPAKSSRDLGRGWRVVYSYQMQSIRTNQTSQSPSVLLPAIWGVKMVVCSSQKFRRSSLESSLVKPETFSTSDSDGGSISVLLVLPGTLREVNILALNLRDLNVNSTSEPLAILLEGFQ